MKITKNLWAIFAMLILSAYTCTSDNEGINEDEPSYGMLGGTWTIVSFTDEDGDEPTSFNGIAIVFDQNGETRLLQDGNLLTNGSWAIRDQDKRLYISFPELRNENIRFSEDLYEIHDDWAVQQRSENEIILFSDGERFTLTKGESSENGNASAWAGGDSSLIDSLSNIVIGQWVVTSFTDGNENETSSFRNITFLFDIDGVFKISRNESELTEGSWVIRPNSYRLDIHVPELDGESERFGEDVYEINDDFSVSHNESGSLILKDEGEKFILNKK